jgi:hypothetical protein
MCTNYKDYNCFKPQALGALFMLSQIRYCDQYLSAWCQNGQNIEWKLMEVALIVKGKVETEIKKN